MQPCAMLWTFSEMETDNKFTVTNRQLTIIQKQQLNSIGHSIQGSPNQTSKRWSIKTSLLFNSSLASVLLLRPARQCPGLVQKSVHACSFALSFFSVAKWRLGLFLHLADCCNLSCIVILGLNISNATGRYYVGNVPNAL